MPLRTRRRVSLRVGAAACTHAADVDDFRAFLVACVSGEHTGGRRTHGRMHGGGRRKEDGRICPAARVPSQELAVTRTSFQRTSGFEVRSALQCRDGTCVAVDIVESALAGWQASTAQLCRTMRLVTVPVRKQGVRAGGDRIQYCDGSPSGNRGLATKGQYCNLLMLNSAH